MAQLLSDGNVVNEIPLGFAGVTSTYSGRLTLGQAGEFEVRVLAMNAANANFGMHRRTLRVGGTDE